MGAAPATDRHHGRAFNEAAAVKPRKTHKAEDTCSLRPRPFNEAAAVKPRKTRRCSVVGWGITPFNEAAAVKPRKTDPVAEPVAGIFPTFNEAAAVKPRKTSLGFSPHPRGHSRPSMRPRR